MKKSEAFYLAQVAVLGAMGLTNPEKLEILRVLMDSEDTAKHVEKFKEEQEQKNEGV
jgi:hypothetical protein